MTSRTRRRGARPAPATAHDRGARVTGRYCAVVLAAGYGARLRPLTAHRPKALCPVGNVAPLDRVLAQLAAAGMAGPDAVAVNASWLADQVVAHAAGRATVSVEPDRPRGTAGGLARLRDWIAGRTTLAVNADAYLAGPPPAEPLLAGWCGAGVRLLGVPETPGEFSGHRMVGWSLLPWRWVRDLPEVPAELVTAVWRPAEAAGALAVVRYPGYAVDTGTVAGYLAANRHAAAAGPSGNLVDPTAEVTGGCTGSVVGAGAVVRGTLIRAVVWPGGTVGPDERLADVVRADGLTLTGRVSGGRGGGTTTPVPPRTGPPGGSAGPTG